jgi:hypothetical protein
MRSRIIGVFLILLSAAISYSADEVISIHPTNFFMLRKGREVFYPLAVNADYLFSPTLTGGQVDRTLAEWESLGINTLRIRVDSLHAPEDPLNLFQEENGRLKPEILSKLDRLIDAAKKHNMFVVLVLFDVQRLAMKWDSSPENKTNGGSIAKLTDWFTDNSCLTKAIERATQLVEQYKARNILSWELARGANVWEMNQKIDNSLLESVSFWVVRLANQIMKVDDRRHPIALSFIPNTYPDTLLGLPQISLHFLQIEARDDRVLAQSMEPYINGIRNRYKKPVFIVDHNWNGDRVNREACMSNLVWASFACCSAAFLSPINRDNQFHIPDSDFQLIQSLKHFMPEVDLSGAPRPIAAPCEPTPKGSFLCVESILGYDRLIWMLRMKPEQTSATLSLNTIEGKYSMNWMDPLTLAKRPIMRFNQLRKSLQLQAPDFERSLFGVLRLEKRGEPKSAPPTNPPPATGKADAGK